jgi:hypothetical protein
VRVLAILVGVWLGACAAPQGVTTETVEPPPLALGVAPTGLVTGEQMVWDVYWQGLVIGRAELRVGAREARSLFTTGTLARAFADVRHELVTSRDDAPSVGPGGATLHTLHSALGAIRAWSRTGAPRAYLWLIVDGGRYRVDLEPPHRARTDLGRALRVDGIVRPLDAGVAPLEITIWLADTAERTPVRFVVVSGDHRLSAELSESTANFSR